MYTDASRPTPYLPPTRPAAQSGVPAARFPQSAPPPFPAPAGCPLQPGTARQQPWAPYPGIGDDGQIPPFGPAADDEYEHGPQLLALRLGTFGLSADAATGRQEYQERNRFLRTSPDDLPKGIQLLTEIQAMGEAELMGRGGRLDLMA